MNLKLKDSFEKIWPKIFFAIFKKKKYPQEARTNGV